MEPIINQIHISLINKRKTIAVAESCTGGLLSSMLTRLPGSSKYFILGIISYSDKAKIKVLKVPAGTIVKRGAVSREVAQKMAHGARKLAKTDLGIGITGIAGPTGATANKPVGTVFIALESADKKACKEFYFRGNRKAIMKNSAIEALKLLKKIL